MKCFFRRLFLLVFIVLLLTIVGGGVWLRWRTRASLPVLDGAIPVPGLSARVEVLRDAHGVPHIRAQSVADALFAQGYVTAQDRLWQMDLSRRNAEGELSEIFGDRTLRLDIESRTLGFPEVAASSTRRPFRRTSAVFLIRILAASMPSSKAIATVCP